MEINNEQEEQREQTYRRNTPSRWLALGLAIVVVSYLAGYRMGFFLYAVTKNIF